MCTIFKVDHSYRSSSLEVLQLYFPIGLVKTESGCIVRSVETGLGRWMLVVAMISVDA